MKLSPDLKRPIIDFDNIFLAKGNFQCLHHACVLADAVLLVQPLQEYATFQSACPERKVFLWHLFIAQVHCTVVRWCSVKHVNILRTIPW